MLPQTDGARPRPRIGRYVITGRLGRGGMGMVYEGLDEALDRKVAIKTITAEGAANDESKRRFQVEARAAARMQHPNIVAVYELGEDNGVQFIAMELLRGTDLGKVLKSGEELLLVEKLDIVIQVCRGLAYAHERHVWHRDMKPDNIGLMDDGTAKIMDFGIAKMEGTQLTKTGMMVGTYPYMSPEQVQGRQLDGRTDVFSMGVILYQLLSGERPFQGDTAPQVLYKIVKEPPPPLDLSSLGEVSERLASIVDKTLAKNREERYQDAAAVADDLRKVLQEVRRQEAAPVDPSALEAVATARRQVRDGRVDDALERLRTVVATNPTLLEARRELRTALRAKKSRTELEPPLDELRSEIEATFQMAPTRSQPETELQPTQVIAESAPPPRVSRRLLLGLAAALVAVGAVVLFALRGGRVATPPPAAEARVPVRSQPLGATVLVDGADSGVVTNGVVVLPSPVPEQVVLTFRKEGHRDETRTVSLPVGPGEAISVTLQSDVPVTPVRSEPAGATVTLDGERVAGVTPLELALEPGDEHVLGLSLDGYVPREVTVAAEEAAEEVQVELEPLPPPGQLSVVSAYPVNVLWRGKSLARGAVSPRVELPAGQQVVTLVSSTVFLRTDRTITVPAGGQTAIEAPGVGEINVQARPDNCEVLIGGTFVDYPPILNREVAAGRHTVTFRWPDGVTSEQVVEVTAGRPTYVTGEKE